MFDPGTTTIYGRACAALRDADRLHAEVVLSLCGIADRSGALPAEFVLRLDGRRPAWEARELLAMAECLRAMPILRGLLQTEQVSFAQARAIVRETRTVDAAGRARVDELVGRRARPLADAEPERLIDEVADLVSDLRADLALAREDRAFARRALHIQPNLDGGARFHGEVDTDAMASLVGAVEAAAARPTASEEDPDLRARQRMDALVAVCDTYLDGGSAGVRPRPRLIASVQVNDLVGMGLSAGARVLAELVGSPQPLSPVTTAALACDAEVVTVLFRGADPIAVSDARKAIPDKVRTAVIARDGGCRFPGCGAPAAWSEVHHIDGRGPGSGHDPPRLVLLCRRCHRRVHRHRWRIEPHEDGAIAFTHRARTYASRPRARLRE